MRHVLCLRLAKQKWDSKVLKWQWTELRLLRTQIQNGGGKLTVEDKNLRPPCIKSKL